MSTTLLAYFRPHFPERRQGYRGSIPPNSRFAKAKKTLDAEIRITGNRPTAKNQHSFAAPSIRGPIHSGAQGPVSDANLAVNL